MKHFFRFSSDDDFIREGQRWKCADPAAAHRRALVRLRKAVWLLSKELRLLEKIYTVESGANGFSTHTPEATAVSTAVPQAVIDEPVYFLPSLSDILSAEEEPILASTKAPAVSMPTTLDALTVRQRDVLSLMMRGMSNKEIARDLKLAEGTVKIHVSALFRKFGAHHRAAAAVVGAQLLAKALGSNGVVPVWNRELCPSTRHSRNGTATV